METETVLLYVVALSGLAVLVMARWELARRTQATTRIRETLVDRERALERSRVAHTELRSELDESLAQHQQREAQLETRSAQLQQAQAQLQQARAELQQVRAALQQAQARRQPHTGRWPHTGEPSRGVMPVEELDLLCPDDDVPPSEPPHEAPTPMALLPPISHEAARAMVQQIAEAMEPPGPPGEQAPGGATELLRALTRLGVTSPRQLAVLATNAPAALALALDHASSPHEAADPGAGLGTQP